MGSDFTKERCEMNSENNNRPKPEDELLVDTSKMSKGAIDAMEIAEASRQHEWSERSFVAQLFMGHCEMELIHPFPEQSEEDRKKGDKFIAELSSYLAENLDPDEVDVTGEIPKNVMDGMAKLGVFAMKIGEEYDGLGLSQVNYNRVMAMISSYCASTAVTVSAHQSIGVPQPLKMFGTEEQKRKFLPRFRKGAIAAFALTEPDVGSDPARMTTTAIPTEDGKYYILNGSKLWCTNSPIADILVVMAKTPPKIVRGKERQQITAFIVERNMPGVEVVQRCRFMGLHGMQNGLVKFTNVKVPSENLVGEEGHGLKMALATLNIGRLTIPAANTGVARQCLSMARRFASNRTQWGQPVGRHEMTGQKLAFIASTTFAMEAITWLSSHFADMPDSDLRMEAAMSKLFCSEAGWKIADMTLQVNGGRGYETVASLKERGDEPFPIERILRDCRINTIIEGTSEIMHLFIAREAMDPHFKLAGNIMRKSVSMGGKIKTLFKMLGFYSIWYPAQWIGSFITMPEAGMGRLSGHISYTKRTAHRLARTVFGCMARYQASLERRQMILLHLVEIGMELFAIAATCSYAVALKKGMKGDKTAEDLADCFCSQARRRIRAHFMALKCNDDKKLDKLSAKVMDGALKWMEHDIVWIGKKE